MSFGTKQHLTNHGYAIGPDGVLPKPYRPKSIGDGRMLIKQVFARQGIDGWDVGQQVTYLRNHGIDASSVNDLTPEQVRTCLREMEENSRMISFRD